MKLPLLDLKAQYATIKDETNNSINASQVGSELTKTSLARIDATAEQIAIRRNPDGTNYIIITRQTRSEPAKKKTPQR